MDARVLFRENIGEYYSASEKHEIERVIHAFYNYLRDSKTCELVWSDKAGYLFFTMTPGKHRIRSTVAVRSADELVRLLLTQISREIRMETRTGRLFHRPHPKLCDHVGDYMDQLPEYQNYVAACQ